MQRPQVSDEAILKCIELVIQGMGKKIEKHGRGAWMSRHETYGILAEEVDEVLEELRGNDNHKFAEELVDIAVVAIFGIASMVAGSEVVHSQTVSPEESEEEAKPQHVDIESAAEQARRMMIERAKQSGLVIPD
jgi:NTP pyrophosphatase (non-canonical NTP hydrolase)